MSWWRPSGRPNGVDDNLDREMAFHIEEHAAELVRRGYSRDEAVRRARLDLGGPEQVKEACRDAHRTRWLLDAGQDIQYAVRSFRKSLSFSVAAIVTLGLGIGSTTAVFTVVDNIMLRPFAVPEPEQLMVIHERIPKFSHLAYRIPASAYHFLQWQRSCQSFRDMALAQTGTITLTGDGDPASLNVAKATASLWSVVGVGPELGRPFSQSEDHPGKDNVALISHELWRGRFSGSPHVLGRRVVLNDRPYEIIGVLPPRFPLSRIGALSPLPSPPATIDVWIPIALEPSKLPPFGKFYYTALGRLKPGITQEQATSELNVIQGQISAALPDRIELKAHVTSIKEQVAGPYRQGLLLLLSAVGLFLLIGCVNVANLLFVRNTVRRREIALRVAIGAQPHRILRQLLVENLLLAVIGGVCGVMLAELALRLALSTVPGDWVQPDTIQIDSRVLLFAAALSALVSVMAGLLPAWRSSRLDPQPELCGGGRTATESRSVGRWRSTLVGVQITLSVAALIVTGLLTQSFARLLHVNPGFSMDSVYVTKLSLTGNQYTTYDRRAAFLKRAISEMSSLQGLSALGVTNLLPLAPDHNNNILVPEGSTVPIAEHPVAEQRFVNSDFFRTLGIPLLSGRLFSEGGSDTHVAVLSEAAAKRLWPSENAIGKQLRMSEARGQTWTVIGVVGDVRDEALDRAPRYAIYLPFWIRNHYSMVVAVRSSAHHSAVAADLRRLLRQIDPGLPISAVTTLADVTDAAVAPRRFQLAVLAGFAVAALLLASCGIYGVIAYAVSLKRAELGVRLALGATPTSLRWMVIGQGLVPVVAGVLFGAISGIGGGTLIRAMLFGVTPTDTTTIATVIALVLVIATVACWIPARRASRFDPLTVLRQ